LIAVFCSHLNKTLFCCQKTTGLDGSPRPKRLRRKRFGAGIRELYLRYATISAVSTSKTLIVRASQKICSPGRPQFAKHLEIKHHTGHPEIQLGLGPRPTSPTLSISRGTQLFREFGTLENSNFRITRYLSRYRAVFVKHFTLPDPVWQLQKAHPIFQHPTRITSQHRIQTIVGHQLPGCDVSKTLWLEEPC